MTALAADTAVVRLGTSLRLQDRAEIGGVAVERPSERLGREETTQIAALVGWYRGVVHGPVPVRLDGITRQPEFAILSRFLARHEGLTLMI
jgi:hypothetical protein